MKKYSSVAKAQDLIDHYKFFPTPLELRSILNKEELQKKHIVFVGDSFVYGSGINASDTMSSQFGTKLEKSDEYGIFNIGIPGGSLDSSLLVLQQWCNSYSDKIHSVYFGITSKARVQYWIDEEHTYNYIPGKENVPKPENTVGDEIFLAKSLNKLVAVQEFQTIVKVNHTMQHLKTLSQLHNFNVMSFYTTHERVSDEEMNEIKKLEDEKFIIHDEYSKSDKQEFYVSQTDRHWSREGNKYLVDNILYPKTINWYQ